LAAATNPEPEITQTGERAKNGPAGGDQYQSPRVDFEESTAELASSPASQDLKFDLPSPSSPLRRWSWC
jgi:hypothetical protein